MPNDNFKLHRYYIKYCVLTVKQIVIKSLPKNNIAKNVYAIHRVLHFFLTKL